MLEEVQPFLSQSLCPINIFHINGDEVEQALATLEYRKGPAQRFNIIYPAWELSRYPQEWARQLDRFDEIWAPSQFIADALRDAVSRQVVHMPLACEVIVSSFLGRRRFGIPETAYAFLFFFDLRSYASRKNPDAVLAAFGKLLEGRGFANAVLVLKVNGAETAPVELESLKARLQPYRARVVLIDRTMTDNEVKNLVRTCDCFTKIPFSSRIVSAAAVVGPFAPSATIFTFLWTFLTVSPVRPPSGCRFRTRCWKAQDLCAQELPLLQLRPGSDHPSACHFAEKREIVATDEA